MRDEIGGGIDWWGKRGGRQGVLTATRVWASAEVASAAVASFVAADDIPANSRGSLFFLREGMEGNWTAGAVACGLQSSQASTGR